MGLSFKVTKYQFLYLSHNLLTIILRVLEEQYVLNPTIEKYYIFTILLYFTKIWLIMEIRFMPNPLIIKLMQFLNLMIC